MLLDLRTDKNMLKGGENMQKAGLVAHIFNNSSDKVLSRHLTFKVKHHIPNALHFS